MSTENGGNTAAENPVRELLVFDRSAMFNFDKTPGDMPWRDHVVEYLRVAASIEHALMVQYLFAAYSLNSQAKASEEDQQQVVGWRDLLLSIAREEMGHFLTVQNVLCLLGAQTELMRDYQYGDQDFHPFPFQLEPLTMDSLNRYTVAEMPDKIPEAIEEFEKIKDELIKYRKNLPRDPGTPHVGEIYQYVLDVIHRIPDCEFHEDTYRFQASWDDWGRGYNTKAPMHGNTEIALLAEHILSGDPRRANVIIERVATRTQVKAALRRISEQGETPPTMFMESHFQRFFVIRMQFDKLQKKYGENWAIHRVAENPCTPASIVRPGSMIRCHRSAQWADLFDIRYHMLLSYLGHTFELACDGSDARLRGAVIHKVFGEMYNLKAIAGILVRRPLNDTDDPNDPRAGPPFTFPASWKPPTWQGHGNLIAQAVRLNDALSAATDIPAHEHAYLQTLGKGDEDAANWIDKVIAGSKPKSATP